MEFSLHIDSTFEPSTIENFDKYSRLYFGNDFCELLQPNEKEFEYMLSVSNIYKKSLTLTTSPMSQSSLESLIILIEKYHKDLIEASFEIVFNDFGVYEAFKKYNDLNLVCGRVLARFKRDPRQNTIVEHLDSLHTQTNINGQYIQDLFKRTGVNRIDMDWSPNVKVNSDNSQMNYSIITPWIYLTTTRLCRLNELNLYDIENRLRIGKKCTRQCKNTMIIMNNQSMQRKLWAVGNTIFYKLEEQPSQGDKNFYNRIVEYRSFI